MPHYAADCPKCHRETNWGEFKQYPQDVSQVRVQCTNPQCGYAWSAPMSALRMTVGGSAGSAQPQTVDATLKERGSRYGVFTEHARITQNLKRAMADSPNWATLADDQRETLEMVAHKIGRILNGDPNYDDSWVDIEGYTRLITKRLQTGEKV